MQIKKSIIFSVILSLTVTSALLFLYIKNNSGFSYGGNSKVENSNVNDPTINSPTTSPEYSAGQTPTNLPRPTAPFITGDPISYEEWMNIAGFPKDLNAEKVMKLVNDSRKANGLNTLIINDNEVCEFAQSALDLLVELNRLPTAEEVKVLKGPKKEIRVAQSLGYSNEEAVVNGFKNDNDIKFIFEAAELKYGCTKTKSNYVVTTVAF